MRLQGKLKSAQGTVERNCGGRNGRLLPEDFCRYARKGIVDNMMLEVGCHIHSQS